eukprot:scaffold1315_cov217-Chaetoceros_neogracile.AAC.7
MDIVASQSVKDRLGTGSVVRRLCSDPRKSRRIVMKNLWGLGSHSSGRIYPSSLGMAKRQRRLYRNGNLREDRAEKYNMVVAEE